VSLLVEYEDCCDCFDWIVGIHGILIKFMYGTIQYSATYLPEVAKEQRWNQKQTIHSLARKAGFTGKINNDLFEKIYCTRYKSSKNKMTYVDYIDTTDFDPLSQIHMNHQESPIGWKTCNNL